MAKMTKIRPKLEQQAEKVCSNKPVGGLESGAPRGVFATP